MDDMVERVAMALAAEMEEGFPRFTQQRWDQLTVLARAAFRQRARVAIEAMREPTAEMVGRAAGGPQWATSLSGKMHEASWKLMIDAALTSK